MDKYLELAQAIDSWLVGDWMFKAYREAYPGPACIEKLYIHLCRSMPVKEAEEQALYLTIKGIAEGLAYEQITEATIGYKESPPGFESLESGDSR